MRSFVSFRLSAHICLVSAALCLFSPLKERWPAFALLGGLALLAGLFAAGCQKTLFRLLWGLLPLAALALSGPGWAVRAALLALAVYAAVYLALGRFAPETWRYRREVQIALVLFLVLLAVSGFGSGSSAPTRLLGAAGFVLTLLALRALQLGPAPSASWQAGSAGLFLLPLAGGALAGAAIWLSGPALKYVAYGLSSVLAGIVSAWNAFFTWLMGLFRIGEDFFEYAPYEPPSQGAAYEIASMSTPTPDTIVKTPEAQFPWEYILAALLAAALILLAVRLLRRGAPARKREKRDDGLTEEVLLREPKARRVRRKKGADHTYRGEIRHVYREYLAFLRSRDVRPSESATTAEISAAAAAVLAESDEKLREIYRRCRYSAAPVTQEDVRSAREALDGILRSASGERAQRTETA